tara:strand:- start:374 stop:1111 length:738 start_codon:yes stop_codon:yes gene_type:complete
MEIYNQRKIYQQPFFVYAHRGVPYLEKENTLNSFKKAIELNYDGIELDIMSTKDRQLIVHHDLTIDLDSNNKEIPISDIYYNSLKKKKIPLLIEILRSIGHQTKINIEIKNQGKISMFVIDELIKQLKEFNLIDNIVISSFNPFIIKKSKKTDDRFPTAWIWGKKNFKFYNLYYLILKYFSPDAIHIYHGIASEELIKKTHNKGLKILAYTVNDEKRLKKLISKNIDGVFTDNPTVLSLAKEINP